MPRVAVMPPHQLETPRLLLREFTVGDLHAVHSIWSDPGVARYLLDGNVLTEAESKVMLDSIIEGYATNDFGILAAIDKERKRIVGFCGLRFVEQGPDIEVLYGIAREAWGKGLASEAARAVIQDGLERLRIERIVGMANPLNVASWRVLQKVGMKYERRARDNGEDIVFYAISREPR